MDMILLTWAFIQSHQKITVAKTIKMFARNG